MKLYHGSNLIVDKPKIYPNLRALDFGGGFYLTSNLNQAKRWAEVVTKRRREKTTVNIYAFDESQLATIKVLHFKEADDEWLDFVVANRKGLALQQHYDLVIGPVANDATLPVIDDYMDGKYTKQEAVARLLPQNLTDQYAFLTDNALRLLTFEASE